MELLGEERDAVFLEHPAVVRKRGGIDLRGVFGFRGLAVLRPVGREEDFLLQVRRGTQACAFQSDLRTLEIALVMPQGREGDRAREASEEQPGDLLGYGILRLLRDSLVLHQAVELRRGRGGFDAALYLKDIGYEDDRIAADLLTGAIRETLVRGRPEVRSSEEFEKRLAEDRSAIIKTQAEMTAILIESAATATKLHGLMEDERIPEETKDSVSEQIAWLLFRGFPRAVPLATLRHYRRYLKGAQIRLERARLGPAADLKKEVLFAPYWAQYREAAKPEYAAQVNSAALADYRWMLEEYRVSLFAQELHTPEPISPKRLDAKWTTV